MVLKNLIVSKKSIKIRGFYNTITESLLKKNRTKSKFSLIGDFNDFLVLHEVYNLKR